MPTDRRDPSLNPFSKPRPALLTDTASDSLLKLYESLVHLLPIGVVIAEREDSGEGSSFRYIFANEAAGKAGGIMGQSDIGHMLGERLPELLASDLPRQMSETLEMREVRELENLSVETGAGERSIYRVALLPLNERMVAIFLENVTPQVEAQRERDALMDELKRSNAELEHFAYIASHDLQEPLRMISGYTDLLARRYRGQLDEDADEFIGYITGGSARLKQLIDDLLTYSRVQRAELSYEATSAETALENALRGLDAAIHEARAELRHDALPEVQMAGSQLSMVFQNLIANAIRFRSDAVPVIEISAASEDGVWRFSVADNGIGIDPRFGERIFELFRRLDPGHSEGTGIGLALCKRIVERYGGRIWVEGRSGGGSVFRFTVPIRTREA